MQTIKDVVRQSPWAEQQSAMTNPPAPGMILIHHKWYTREEYEAMTKKFSKPQYNICQPDCPICGGIGWVREDVPVTDARFGKTKPCPNMFQINLRKGATRYGLPIDEVESLDWDMVLDLNDGPQAAEVVKRILAEGAGLVYLWGNHGNAKTLILKIAVAVSLRAGRVAAYVNMSDLLANLREAFDIDDPNLEAKRRLEYWQTLPILAIDEFNRVDENKEFTKGKRFDLMDARNVQAVRGQTITLIASNTSPDAQESYLASRFSDGRFHVITLTGADARPFMTQASMI